MSQLRHAASSNTSKLRAGSCRIGEHVRGDSCPCRHRRGPATRIYQLVFSENRISVEYEVEVAYIVLATGADTLYTLSALCKFFAHVSLDIDSAYLLSVNGTLQLGQVIGAGDGSEEDGLELVHAGIGEQQGGVIVRDDRRRWNCWVVDRDRVSLLAATIRAWMGIEETEGSWAARRMLAPWCWWCWRARYAGLLPSREDNEYSVCTYSVAPLLEVVEEGLAYGDASPLPCVHGACGARKSSRGGAGADCGRSGGRLESDGAVPRRQARRRRRVAEGRICGGQGGGGVKSPGGGDVLMEG